MWLHRLSVELIQAQQEDPVVDDAPLGGEMRVDEGRLSGTACTGCGIAGRASE
ncbi:MAG TPA: hypothetical protein VIG04_03815 [Gemmatimonadales bacterium]